MKVVCDIETNRLYNPDHIWVIVCKDIDTQEDHVFRNLTLDNDEKNRFVNFAKEVTQWVGHNFIQFDSVHINDLLHSDLLAPNTVLDTLVVSRLLDYSRAQGHSLEAYGEEFGIPKVVHMDYTRYSKELELRCLKDVSINYRLYLKLKKYLNSPKWKNAIDLEHTIAYLCNTLSKNGFSFNLKDAKVLLKDVEHSLGLIDREMQVAFQPKSKLVREITPSETKHGTLHKKDFKWVKDGDLTPFTAGAPFSLIEWVDFNPGSPKQVVTVLNEAGWKPLDKTKGHIDFERETQRNRRNKKKPLDFDLEKSNNKIDNYRRYGWKINENNLRTLPEDAPPAAKALAKRIMLESRRKTLVEWIELCDPQSERIHGKFQHIGAWTHRMSHQNPNTANIPREDKLFGREMRSLWRAQKDRLLIGVDAEGIQLRVLAHYIDNEEFTHALVYGNKKEGTDPHSLNKQFIGDICPSRDEAKTFIYAWFLGASLRKVAEIFNCTLEQAEDIVERINKKYEKAVQLKKEIMPRDARRGYFEGFDGRFVLVPGESANDKKHLMPSGYLQNGEAIVMKKALSRWHPLLLAERIPFWFVNFVHDEWQTETINDMEVAKYIANVQAESIRIAGEELGLKCPMAGSILNTHGKIAIGSNWLETH